ncbi:hypothetical protein CDAR_289911 [Caerostris darwini]|uniref:Uncharacterized protein n=1 Tax=Caerostris darwini TaxID=1538125 RepID=A0AAV4WXE6_9ARAC|nr:hypothetical protein CDAR_289911 [Caerostris darwini]
MTSTSPKYCLPKNVIIFTESLSSLVEMPSTSPKWCLLWLQCRQLHRSGVFSVDPIYVAPKRVAYLNNAIFSLSFQQLSDMYFMMSPETRISVDPSIQHQNE